jgi:hypothetical protein
MSDRAFELLNDKFSSTPILTHIDPDPPTKVETEASSFTKSSILSQLSTSDNKWHPKAFSCKKMSPAKLNYDVYNNELKAIVSCFKKYNIILRSPMDVLTVFTDHQNLIYFKMKKVLKPRQIRWATTLAE